MRAWCVLMMMMASQPTLVGGCGNYCGRWYCGGALGGGDDCDYAVDAHNCADACCRAHDACCDGDVRGTCNAALADCLDDCDGGVACLYGVAPLPAWLVGAGMRAIEAWECAGPL